MFNLKQFILLCKLQSQSILKIIITSLAIFYIRIYLVGLQIPLIHEKKKLSIYKRMKVLKKVHKKRSR